MKHVAKVAYEFFTLLRAARNRAASTKKGTFAIFLPGRFYPVAVIRHDDDLKLRRLALACARTLGR